MIYEYNLLNFSSFLDYRHPLNDLRIEKQLKKTVGTHQYILGMGGF